MLGYWVASDSRIPNKSKNKFASLTKVSGENLPFSMYRGQSRSNRKTVNGAGHLLRAQRDILEGRGTQNRSCRGGKKNQRNSVMVSLKGQPAPRVEGKIHQTASERAPSTPRRQAGQKIPGRDEGKQRMRINLDPLLDQKGGEKGDPASNLVSLGFAAKPTSVYSWGEGEILVTKYIEGARSRPR